MASMLYGKPQRVQLAQNKERLDAYPSLFHRVKRGRRSNLVELKEGVPITSLPKTFREAIEIAKWFEITYLWIDSLCIIQNSNEDWQKEAITMKDVYKNALLTVAATAASNSSVGCFFARDQTFYTGIEVPVGRDGQINDNMVVFDKWLWIDGIGKAPLNTRAWVVQERLLSRRVLHFGAQQVYWECLELDACETCPMGLPKALEELQRFKGIGSACVRSLQSRKYDILYGKWECIVSAYTQSNLTRSTDKVIALAGIAAEMALIWKDEYLAGLWRSCLPEQLLWKVSLESAGTGKDSYARRASYPRAPSWSWLSIDGPVDVDSSHGRPVLIEIIRAEAQCPTNAVFTGSISLRGVLTEAFCEADKHGSVRIILDVPPPARNLAFGELDDKYEPPPEKILCLPINSSYFQMDGEDVMVLEGLILCPSSNNEAEYKRVGWFSANGWDLCELIAGGPCTERAIDQQSEISESTGDIEGVTQHESSSARLDVTLRYALEAVFIAANSVRGNGSAVSFSPMIADQPEPIGLRLYRELHVFDRLIIPSSKISTKQSNLIIRLSLLEGLATPDTRKNSHDPLGKIVHLMDIMTWQQLDTRFRYALKSSHQKWWWKHVGQALAIFLEKSDYGKSHQANHLSFFAKVIALNLGTSLDVQAGTCQWSSFMTDDGTPIELSWDWGTPDEAPCIRYSMEAVGVDAGTVHDPYNSHIHGDFYKQLVSSSSEKHLPWYEHFAQYFGYTTTTQEASEGHRSRTFYAFDLAEQDSTWKAYFFPGPKAESLKKSNLEVIREAISTAPSCPAERLTALHLFHDWAS
ncbi:uncharacterized protein KY384_007229 [Bacidia gigantensis]|uniref:uncharacterized protein n=1 Tax=Bacidia gigantensis TaxID=2732470 RepID=UPI001D049568|nr:uncharacterized protein KY384_007229 [Bacidia gigantensis]KAG8528312.1 hypothetical protein KY384_007229 [Bacidia gigantensis]